MSILWSRDALVDLERLHDFVARVNPVAADSLLVALVSAPDRLLDHPRLGLRLDQFAPDDVRRLIVGNYEIRYQVEEAGISILRVFHGKEDRN